MIFAQGVIAHENAYAISVSEEGQRFAEWFQEQLRVRGWSQADFAARTGISTQQVSNWVAGRVPTTLNLLAVARAFGVGAEVPVRVLYGQEVAERAFRPPRSFADALAEASLLAPLPVPLIRAKDARLADAAPAVRFLYLPPEYWTTPRRLFALEATDAAMEPAIVAGDALVVERERRPKLDDVAAIVADGGFTLARLVGTGTRRFYRQDATGETVQIPRPNDLLGVVILVMRSLG